ncbi:MAG: glycosyltransferase family 2 protein [Nostoc sp. DedQUE08]|uniref:glycosyltransferase family 2 protein n=1 Tax=unclassified Nostoc TaxID=2593658 RepID=UPI002AD3E562|nr:MULTISPECIES: glycosyltransferase family 2 protein [unclassified Nostoc]MDZ8069196.1 glycosyltransferase family 2 protein [Nostoc sp. DedQUE08]MDZ8093201.1 glycosyltransferase family 2 protein [Nostoc sp. DedQUE05]
MQTPVTFIIFKRPQITEKVFEAIRQVKPTKLFVIADGPRTDREGEAEKCEATRAIIERVDWDCEVIKNYSDINLGCAKRVSSGLDWVFNNVEETIILEDDCIPHPTFFRFSEELLEKYRNDTRIATISAQNLQLGQKRTNYSYYFSRYNHCWGWASWRRAWQHYDLTIKLWKEVQAENLLHDILIDQKAVNSWQRIFQSVYDNPTGITWDYQWTFACWMQGSLSIIPNVNLISNVGVGADATHFNSNQEFSFINMPMQAMEFALKHPPFIVRNVEADNFIQKTVYKATVLDIFKEEVKKRLNDSTIKNRAIKFQK